MRSANFLQLGLSILVIAAFTVHPVKADETVGDPVGECVGAHSRVAIGFKLAPAPQLPDDSSSGVVNDPDAGIRGVFTFLYEEEGKFWYEFTGKTSTWEECDGVAIYASDYHVDLNLPS